MTPAPPREDPSRAPAAPVVILITDRSSSLDHTADVLRAAGHVLGGSLLVQLRDPEAGADELREHAARLLACARAVGARFVVNARTDAMVEVARSVGADGAHVPCRVDALVEARQRLGPRAWISCPAHTDADVALAAECRAADAVLVSPIGMTPGKGPPRGVAALTSAARVADGRLAIYALGGIDRDLAVASAAAGAAGVAVIRALLAARDPTAAARELARPFAALG